MSKNGSKEEKLEIEGESDIVKTLKAGDIGNAFSNVHGSNIADKLIEPGEDPLGISMRSYFGKQTEGSIYAVAFTADWCGCIEFEDEDGLKGLLMLASSKNSDRGRAREDLVNAIIGDKQMRAHSGFINGVKNWYGNQGEKAEK